MSTEPESAERIVPRLRRLPDIPEGHGTWRVFLNGVEIGNPIYHLLLVLEKPSRPALGLELGWINDGRFAYDGLSHFESAGGAVVCVPFIIWQGELYIALIEQYRALVGGTVETVPRGYGEIGKSAKAQAATELAEEVGGQSASWVAFLLDGEPMSVNTAIANTTKPRPDGERAGTRFFGLEIGSDFVQMDEHEVLKFKDGVVSPTDERETFTGWRLARWHEAVQGHDSAPATAVARLLAHLARHGQLTITHR